jgi:hypothetical protein
MGGDGLLVLIRVSWLFAGLHEVDWIKPQPTGKGY